jgi:hypothetical protein
MGPLGYIPSPAAIENYLEQPGGGQYLMAAAPLVLENGKGKEGFLWEIEQRLTGSVRPPHLQTIGDCVSHGFSGACDDLQFVQMLKSPTNQFKELSTEAIYGIARIQIGKGQCGSEDGAVVAWALEGGQKFGLLPRGVYGSYDVSAYNANLAKKWGMSGTPQELCDIAKSHLVTKAFLIEGSNKYEQARDVIASGGVVVTGSNTLYSQTRDREGFCKPQGSGGHCTYYRGFKDDKRPGLTYQQSWGPNSPTGGAMPLTLPSGKEIALPPGAFFCDAADFERAHRGQDSEVWAITAEDGWLPPDDQIKFVFYV